MPRNIIKKSPAVSLGYNFIKAEFLPEGKDEYYLRNLQNRSGIEYRQLTAFEIESLVLNRNTSDNWNNILVSGVFNADLIKNCKFFGLVRIGNLENICLEFSDMKYAVGLYNSTIISCDFGNNVVIDNVNYLSHYIIGNEVIIVNVNELATTDHSKFGNGILKEGENENLRIWMEICNENGGRSVIPFNGMQPGDAYLWSKFRDDEMLLQHFKAFTEKEFKKERGYYGKVGDRTVIKNSAIIKDVWIGEDAYIKGANKLKNLTINSGEEGKTQIGEGCEIVNGIIGFGCRIFYGVKAVRFIMASHSQLKYGARLINSYLGNNATISCCEVLNSLIFPAHEQHHNNSFLCAALVMGQSNIPAGATLGSNHNSRAADGEIVAGRGFWPGLCVSLKHNSKFASFTMLAKGDYPFELNISIPFSLVSMDNAKDELTIMPAYWFMYNFYALERNAWKCNDRDKRKEKIQLLEYDYLAPDTVNEMFDSLHLFETLVGKAFCAKEKKENISEDEYCKKGKELLREKNPVINELKIVAEGFENSKRKTVILKIQRAYDMFSQMIFYYGMSQLFSCIKQNNLTDTQVLANSFPNSTKRNNWLNTGGQLIPEDSIKKMRSDIYGKKINTWENMHAFYQQEGIEYPQQKILHALASLEEIENISLQKLQTQTIAEWFERTLITKEWIVDEIYKSRAKDYSNPFRKMVYDSEREMNDVLGKLEENSFINQQKNELEVFRKDIAEISKRFSS
jgi:hypothetical protein